MSRVGLALTAALTATLAFGVPSASAASWTIAEPLSHVADDAGHLDQPAGVALRVSAGPGVVVAVFDEAGSPLTVPTAGGWIVPAPERSRTLRVEVPSAARVWVQWSESPSEYTAWVAWDVALAAAIRRGTPPPDPPEGSGRSRASVTLRSRAHVAPAVAWASAQADVVELRRWTRSTHLPGAEVAVRGPVRVAGPGMVVVRVQVQGPALTRFQLVPGIDGQALPAIPIASAGSAPVPVRVWVPPGVHYLTVEADGTEPRLAADGSPAPGSLVSLTAQPLRMRPALARWPYPDERVTHPADPTAAGLAVTAAEAAWMRHDRAAALAAFEALVDEPDAVGELARARVVELSPDVERVRTLAAPREGTSAEGLELLADAVLRRADDLSPEVVLAAVSGAVDPDLGLLARWMNDLGGLRPRGQALLAAATRDVPVGTAWNVRALRESSLYTRWTRLPPDPAATVEPPRLRPESPGIPRLVLAAGETAPIELPVVPRARYPVLRMRAEGEVAYTLDGQRLASPGGSLDVALPVGAHTLSVQSGYLVLLDPEVVVTGGTRVWEHVPARLPARWTLPDRAFAGEVRIGAEPAGPIGVRFDAGDPAAPVGPTVWLTPQADGSYPIVPVPPGVAGATVEGRSDMVASLAIRTSVPEQVVVRPPAWTDDEERALAELASLSERVDAGRPGALLERAILLGRLGQVQAARRDLSRIVPADPAEAELVNAWWSAVVPPVPSAPAPGPRTLEAALAAAELVRPPPSDPAELEALARQTDAPMVWLAAAQARAHEGDLPAAWTAARAAGDLGRDFGDDLEARVRWSPVTFVDRSAGSVVVPVPEREGPSPELWRRVRDALVTPPWPAGEGVVLRGAARDSTRFTGEVVRVELWCRDEISTGQACRFPVEVDHVPHDLAVADGGRIEARWEVGEGAHTVTVHGAGAGLAVAARVWVDDVVVPPTRLRKAFKVRPGHPVDVTVASPALLRVRVARGVVRLGERTMREGPDSVYVPLAGAGAVRLQFEGDGELILDVGTLDAEPPVRPPEEAPPRPPLLDDAVLTELVARYAGGVPVPLRVPSLRGSVWAAASGRHERVDRAPPWNAFALDAGWGRGAGTQGGAAQVWVDGPIPAAGLAARGWLQAPAGFLAGEVGASGGGALPDEEGRVRLAGAVWARLDARWTVPLGASEELRLMGRARGGLWTAPGTSTVDPRAWTRFASDHPLQGWLDAAFATTRWTDLHLDAGGGVRTNSPNGGGVLDAVGGFVHADGLLGRAWALSADVTSSWRFVDAHRGVAGLWTTAFAGASWSTWDAQFRRWEVWARAGVEQDTVEARFGLTVLWSRGRGLYDLPPASEPFRTAQDLP